MNEYIIPHIQIRKKNLSQSREKFHSSEPKPASLPDELSKKEEYSFETINIQEIISSKRDYIVVGDSGIGKTSLLLWMGKQIALEGEKAKYIPLFIQMSDISQIKIGNEFLSLLNTRYNLDEYDIKDRRFLFLLDGLDQIGEFGNIQDRLKRKDIFGERNKIILTTRPIGYEWVKKDLENRYEYLQIQPFDKEKIQEYIGRYVNDKHFQTILSQNKELLKVPILLKMVKALLSTDRLSEIRNRTSLYEEFIRNLFEDWESAKKGHSSAYTSAIEIQKDLAELSFHAIENNYLGSFPLEMGCKYFSSNKERLDEIISWSVTHNLIEKEGQKVIAYAHQSFQEYLAAQYLKDILFKDNLVDRGILEKCLEYKRWDETIVFTVGILDKEMAKILINTIRGYDLYLAGLCLREYKGFHLEFNGLINKLLENIDNMEAQLVLIKLCYIAPIIKRLVISLKSVNWDTCFFAIYILGEIGSEKAVKPLLLILMNKSTGKDIRREAADALGKIGSEVATKSLISILIDKTEDLYVRWSATKALSKIDSEKAIKPLLSTLMNKSTDEGIRLEAADALGKIGSEAAVKPLISILIDKTEDWVFRDRITGILGEIDSEAPVKPLISILIDKTEDWMFRTSVARALGKIGSEEAVEPLLSIFKDRDLDKDMDMYIRLCAADALVEIGSEKIVKSLLSILINKSTGKDIRREAADALGKIGSEVATKSLISIFIDKTEDLYVRWSATKALSKIDSEKAIKPLLSTLMNKSTDEGIRREAADALGEIGSEVAVKPLISVLIDKTEDLYVRKSAADALGKIDSEKAIKPLLSTLMNEDTDKYVRQAVAYALSKKGSEAAVKPLVSILNDETDECHHLNVVNALGKTKSKEAVEPLITIFKDRDMDMYIRLCAADALVEIGSENAVKSLISIFKDQDTDADFSWEEEEREANIRWEAVVAISEIMKKLNEQKQDILFSHIYSLKFDNESKKLLFTLVKYVTARRFIKITSRSKNQ